MTALPSQAGIDDDARRRIWRRYRGDRRSAGRWHKRAIVERALGGGAEDHIDPLDVGDGVAEADRSRGGKGRELNEAQIGVRGNATGAAGTVAAGGDRHRV